MPTRACGKVVNRVTQCLKISSNITKTKNNAGLTVIPWQAHKLAVARLRVLHRIVHLPVFGAGRSCGSCPAYSRCGSFVPSPIGFSVRFGLLNRGQKPFEIRNSYIYGFVLDQVRRTFLLSEPAEESEWTRWDRPWPRRQLVRP